MTADLLREAAALMRERAEAVTARLTKCERPDECSADGFCGSPLAGMRSENATHIASWHPAVALAVADLLDHHAKVPQSISGPLLAVARAYMNSEVPNV